MAVKSSFKNMVLCLGLVTLVCSILLAFVYDLTQEPVAKAAQVKTQKAIAAVLPQYEYLGDKVEEDGIAYHLAYGADSSVVAYAIYASETGFGGPIKLLVGIRADGSIYNTSVLSHSETPGLGAKCTEEQFASQFRGFDPALKMLKVTKDYGDVDAITASTITSRAYCSALAAAYEGFQRLRDRRIAALSDTLAVSADSLAAPAGSLDVALGQDGQIMEDNQNE